MTTTVPTRPPPPLWWLSLTYAGSFAVLGAVMPYLALDLQRRGLNGLMLTAAMGALPLGRLLAGPAWSLLADVTRSQRQILRVSCGLALLGLSGTIWSTGWVCVLSVLLLAIGRSPMIPVVDGLTLQTLGGDQARYGLVRRWGSVGFLLATLAAPLALQYFPIPALLPGLVLSALLWMMVWRLPDGTPQTGARLGPALQSLGRDRSLRWILACAALHFAAHIAATSFLAIHMASLGLSEMWAGVALALGVLVEIILMSRGPLLLSRVGPERLMVMAIGVAFIRWVLTALASTGWQLLLLQCTHGFTFGAFWIASVALVSARSAPAVKTSAQGLLSAAVGGIGSFIGMTTAGLVTASTDTRVIFVFGAGFAAASALCALGLRRSDIQS